MKLKTWIVKTGAKKAAKLLGVEPATVSIWKTRDGLPKPRTMVKIHHLSDKKVSYEEMITTAARRK